MLIVADSAALASARRPASQKHREFGTTISVYRSMIVAASRAKSSESLRQGIVADQSQPFRRVRSRRAGVGVLREAAKHVICETAISNGWRTTVKTDGGLSPSSRIGGVFDPALVADQRVSRKGLHYSEWLGTLAVAIRGGGCGGNWSLSCWMRSRSSGSG
jgi:hypothetical protein